MDETKNGRLGPLGVATEKLIGATPITPRFCIREQHGTQADAYRVIGDLKRSKINATLGQNDTYRPDAIYRFFALVREVKKTRKERIAAWTGDFHKAYKMLR